jgi:hypothetical protein
MMRHVIAVDCDELALALTMLFTINEIALG